MTAIVVLAPLILPDPRSVNPRAVLVPLFSGQHLLGTDDLGRDFLARLVHGGRYSLAVGVLTAAIAVTLGTVAGALAGYRRGWVDAVIGRLIDVMLSVPTIPFVMVLAAFVEMTPLRMILVIAVFQWMPVARLVRGEFLSLREREFVLAARAIGVSGGRIVLRHLLPNAIAPIAVAATLVVANAILIESALSYLGFGVQPPTPTWGNLLTRAQTDVQFAPWLAIFPGVLLALCVTSIMFVGDALRQSFDPKVAE